MPLNQWQLALRKSQLPVTQTLKGLGFRKSGNYYNRPVRDGLVQVVGFQSGQAVSIFHGSFTVNLGVFVPCIAELEGNAVQGRTVTDAHCEIRSRLSKVANLGADKWWPLDESASQSGEEIAMNLKELGVPFLDRYASNEAIVERFISDGELPFRNPSRSSLAVAIILSSSGAADMAKKMFERAAKERSNNVYFSEYVRKIQTRCGL